MPFVVPPGPIIDRSATLAATTSTQLMAANSNRQYLFIQNTSGTDMWVGIGATAGANQPCIKLTPNTWIEWRSPGYVPTDVINAWNGTGSSPVTAKEY